MKTNIVSNENDVHVKSLLQMECSRRMLTAWTLRLNVRTECGSIGNSIYKPRKYPTGISVCYSIHSRKKLTINPKPNSRNLTVSTERVIGPPPFAGRST